MSKVIISAQDEDLLKVIRRKGLKAGDSEAKWKVLRLALAMSWARQDLPSEDYDQQGGGSSYAWEQVCGQGQGLEVDYTDSYRAILSVLHDCDLFAPEQDGLFAKLLQRHIRRGFSEIKTGWRETHDFYEYLYQELLSRSYASESINNDIAPTLLNALNEVGIRGKITNQTDGARLLSFSLLLEDATHLRLLQRASQDSSLALIMGTGPISLTLPGTPRTVTVLVPKPKSHWRTVSWNAIVDSLPKTEDAALGVALGVDPTGAVVTFDLAQAPHLLVAGTTNSGKSVVLHAIICSLLSRHTTESLRLSLIDPKQVEFSVYKGLPHLNGVHPITDMAQAKGVLDEIVVEMGAREAQLAELGFKNLGEWKRQRTDSPPYWIVFVEELADLIMQHPDAEVPLVRLAQKGRASGIHLVLATQRPDSVTLSGLLRTNIPSRIALSVQKASESRIIFDDTGAELLLGQGDALVKFPGENVQRVQCALVTSSDAKNAVATASSRK